MPWMYRLLYDVPQSIGGRQELLPAKADPLAHLAESVLGGPTDGINAQRILAEQAWVMHCSLTQFGDETVIHPRVGEPIKTKDPDVRRKLTTIQRALQMLHLPFECEAEPVGGNDPEWSELFTVVPTTVTVKSLSDYIQHRRENMQHLRGAHRRAFDLMALAGKVIDRDTFIEGSGERAQDYISPESLGRQLHAEDALGSQVVTLRLAIGIAGVQQAIRPDFTLAQGGTAVDFGGLLEFGDRFSYGSVSKSSLASLLPKITNKKLRAHMVKAFDLPQGQPQ